MTARAAAQPRTDLLSDYVPLPGVADELFQNDGTQRPVWNNFLRELQALSTEEVTARFSRGEQYLRDAGVFFRLYSAGPMQEREWPLSHVPVLIADDEWSALCEALSQRADLMEQTMADLYGPGSLIQNGHLPAELVACNAQWLRPHVGITPRSGHFLHHIAFEVGRSPDGSFFVLGDRTQAPSGSGFALENRMATSRIFSEPFPRSHVRRLAGYFRAFREAMESLTGEGRRMAILTPGPNNDAYYEHTYIARYLGLTLLEGEDLLVENGQAMVRTVRGLEPLGLLWRRIDGEFVDPLELNETSQIGTPGLSGALREGGLTLINFPGSGILETRAFMAFWPKICEAMRGEPLKIPNIATWWCGQKVELEHVRQNADRMILGGAFDTSLPFASTLGPSDAQSKDGQLAKILQEMPASQAAAYVGQEAVSLSTTPVWHEGKLVPRPMTIRVFAARTETGWIFMPGGYARIGKGKDATALAMQEGGAVADVWVVAPKPVAAETLVSRSQFERSAPGILPSRAADNLYWLGRYVERTEGAIRLLRAYHLRLAEIGDPNDLLLQDLTNYLDGIGLRPDTPIPAGLSYLVNSARLAAEKVRDRFSPDGWNALNDLSKTTLKLAAKVEAGADSAHAMSILLRKISAFSGLVHENMYHFAGWRFLSVGRSQERADAMLALLETFAKADAAGGALEIAIEVGDSVMTHQRRYRFGPSVETVLDLLVQDGQNPRSVLYQISHIRELAEALPQAGGNGPLTELEKVLLTLETELRVAAPSDLDTSRLFEARRQLARVFELLSSLYFR
ncbi:circularly permuted type 2 ATP-grasp protein [Thioclava sp. FR2]|uniref:circularly permuted type 2 ATP-grasp protein n=1 Tax=Thioclava sp. FR2 TaxID=3445780 RepID=UPI003EBC8673